MALAQAPLTPNSQSRWLDAAGHLAWLRDDSGKLTLEDVRAHDGFQPLSGSLNDGHAPAAVWLRFDVRPEADAPAHWILEVANALIDDVRLYVKDDNDRYVEHRSGDNLPRWQWEIDCRNPAFHVRFDTPGLRRFYLRLWIHGAVSVPVRLWQAEAFDTESRNDSFIYGIFYGICGLVLLFHLGAHAFTRERINAWFAFYLALYGVSTAIASGHFQQITLWHGPQLDLILALTVCISLGVSTTFALLQMDTGTVMPRFTRFFQLILWGSAIACALWVLLGHFDAGAKAAQMLMLLAMVILLAIGVRLALRRHRPARYFLLVFGIVYAAVMARYLRELGLVAPSALGEYGIALATLIHTIAVSLNISRRSDELKRTKLAEQASLNMELEVQVAARTSELTAEIATRAALERELREALVTVTAARQQQRDFVAMVSHEFRTPLTIIDTSAQRIAGTAQASLEATRVRCGNIRVATRRMTQLMDEFLSLDRLDGDLRDLKPESCDPRELVERIAAEFLQARLGVHFSDLPSRISCDISLLRIALDNLLANALRYSPAGAPVSLSARGLADGAVEFIVANEGASIHDDELPMLFQRYFRGRASKTQSGAGLGLYLVDHIARLHGGTVRVESTPENRTLFILLLPARR